jgi:predicted RNA-binding Zn-ribbon protein involved in translation (DUF1610 family)
MSEYIDIKYVNLLSPRLDRFKVKTNNPFTANFRCPICGDSKKNKHKARGYVYVRRNGVLYKCHNCGYGASLGNFIKEVDPHLYSQYTMERYKEGNVRQAHANVTNLMTFEQPVFNKKSILDELCVPVRGTPAEIYLKKRNIPESKWNGLYYVDDIEKLEKLSSQYEGRIVGNEGRLVVPFYNRDNVLVGVTCRALGDERLRYVSIRINQDSPMVYNLNKVDITKPIYVTEGPIDSMFLDNAVAAGNSDLITLKNILPLDKMIFIFDNQPRNKELVKIMERATEQNINMVIWPENILEKDINDMILKEIDVHSIISTRSFNGLSLKLEFTKWRKI